MTESEIIKKTEEKSDCKKKYLYEHTMFWECNDGCKCQILEDDVVDLLNEQQTEIKRLENTIFNLKNEIYNLKNDKDYYIDKRRFDLYD